MKLKFTLLLILSINFAFSQTKEKVTIPNGVVYNYASEKSNENTRKLLNDNLLNNDYSLLQNNLMIGPTLWKRFKNIETLKSIPDSVIFHIDDKEIEGKISKNLEDSKKIWNVFTNEILKDFKIRKANEYELKYYWATISFDINEPLFVIESENHKYILNFIEDSSKLFWIDEIPSKNLDHNPIENSNYQTDGEFKTYQNGNEIYTTDKGIKETKLEKVVLLNSDSELKENSSNEDISEVVNKTNKIFKTLFSNSMKPGKIMVQFELNKRKNEIQFAVKDDVDLELMKEFEKQVNIENYPNSKKKSVKIQLIYKVNSLNETE